MRKAKRRQALRVEGGEEKKDRMAVERAAAVDVIGFSQLGLCELVRC